MRLFSARLDAPDHLIADHSKLNARRSRMQDEPEWYNGDSDKHEAEEDGELFEFGEECLDRLALALGGTGLLPLAQAALPQLLQSPDWKQRHAALICLAQTAEGCVKAMLRQLAPWVDICLMVCPDASVPVSSYSATVWPIMINIFWGHAPA